MLVAANQFDMRIAYPDRCELRNEICEPCVLSAIMSSFFESGDDRAVGRALVT
jgi:hypothetical protein